MHIPSQIDETKSLIYDLEGGGITFFKNLLG